MLPKFEHYLVSPQMSLQSLELQLKRSKVIEICWQREDMPPIVEIVEYEKLQLKSNIKRFVEDTTLLQGLMIGIVIFWGGKKYVCSNRLICFGRMWCRSHGRRWRLSRITYGSDVRGQISSALPISHLYWPFLLPPLSLRFCWVPMLYQIPPLQYQGLTHKSHIYIFSADTFLECILTWSILVMVLLREVYTGGRRRQEDYLFPQPVTSEEEAISCNWPTPPFHTLYYVPSSFICIYMVQQSLIVHGHFVFDSTLVLLNFN